MNNAIQAVRHNVPRHHIKAMILMLIGLVRKTQRTLQLARSVRAERKALAKLTDRELRDIGIARADAEYESKRSSLDLPIRRRV